jgi:hypothetical protein
MRINRWLIILASIAIGLLSYNVGTTSSSFADVETSSLDTFQAWLSSQWVQTTRNDFESGVINNLDTSLSPGDVQLSSIENSTIYVPSRDSGDWTKGSNGYLSDNRYATFTPSTTIATDSPSDNSGSAWTNPTHAYTSGTSCASLTSSSPSGNNSWGKYGFSLNSDPIDKVRVRYDAWSPGATISFVGAGKNGKSTKGNVTPVLPTGWAPNDIFLCIIASRDNVNSTMPAGWIAINSGTNNGSGLRSTIFYRRASAKETDPIVTHTSGSFISAYILAYRGCIGSGSPIDVQSSVKVNSSSKTLTFCASGTSSTKMNDLIVLVGATASRVTSTTYTGSPTPAERIDGPDTANYPENIVADFILDSPGNIGSRTSTLSGSSVSTGIAIALKPDMPDIRVDASWDGGSSWSAKQTTTLTGNQTAYWYDVTSATSWTPEKLNDKNLQVRVDAVTNTFDAPVYLDWLPVEVTSNEVTGCSHTYSNYNISLSSSNITHVEIGLEAYAASSEKVQIETTWDCGKTWSYSQTSSSLGNSDPNSLTWFDFTEANSWTPEELNNSNFEVRISYLSNGAFGQVSLDYLPVRVTTENFFSSGTLASQIRDTGTADNKWEALFWSETLLTDTDITFEVRASDVKFAKSDASPDWIPVGEISPVTTGLPSGRYKQWKATLNSSDSSKTPVLSEVRAYCD